MSEMSECRTEFIKCVEKAIEAFENGQNWRPFIGLIAHAEAERDRELPEEVPQLRIACRPGIDRLWRQYLAEMVAEIAKEGRTK
jgi:hypothetical protein